MTTNLLKGIQPFWFWNGKMDHAEIVRQIDEMAEKHVQGFLIHPRQGLDLPYLTEEYFERVKTAVDAAKKHGMEVWLYDEYPYPSGVSAGQVMLDHPEYCCKALKKTVGTVKGPDTLKMYCPWGKVVSARAYKVVDGKCDFSEYMDLTDYVGTGYSDEIFQLSGLTAYNRKRFFTGTASKYLYWTAPEGEWKVYVYIEEVMKHFKYFENFVDPLNPAAIRYFLETTHEKYKKYIGEEFGKTVKGVFTDEVTAFPPQEPWSPLLPGLVKEKYGRDLIDVLPALSEDMGPETQKIRFEYWDVATDAFIESYDKQVYNWCDANNLMYIGEKPILRSKELEWVHVPGTDSGHAKVGAKADPLPGNYRANGKVASSAAHFYNKPATLCEAFHSIGWGMTTQDMKWIFDWLAMTGIDWYVQHAFYYTTDALAKHDAPPSSFCQMPWWKEQKHLSDYAIGLGKMLGGLKRHVRTLLVDPATSSWVLTHKEKAEQREAIGAVMTSLMNAGCDFYVIDPQLLAQARVEEQRGKTVIVVKGEAYESLVLPNMNNIEDCAYKVVRQFVEDGGLLAAAGDIPMYNVQEEHCAEWFAKVFESPKENLIKTSVFEIGRELAAKLQREGWIYENVPEGAFAVTGLNAEGNEQAFIINTTAQRVKVQLKKDMTGVLKQLDLVTMETKSVKPFDGILSVVLEPWASVVYIIEDGVGEEQMQHQVLLPFKSRKWSFTRSKDNALYLGKWNITLADGQTGVTGCYPIIDQMEELGLKMPVKTVPYFGCPKELAFQNVDATFDTEFVWEVAEGTPAWLVMEPGTLQGEWTLNINGHEVKAEDFAVKEYYLNTNLATDVTAYIQPGLNHVKVHVLCSKNSDGLRNPLYIFGDFGVELDVSLIKAVPAVSEGTFGDQVANGLPFYAGDVTYRQEVILEDVPTDEEIVLNLDAPQMQDMTRVFVNGVDCGICAWTPRTLSVAPGVFHEGANEVEIVVTNTLAGLFEGQYFDQKQHKYIQLTDQHKDVTAEKSFQAW
ncbi:MAG: hypothetical protein IJ315_07275 [Firmicutes bacterium]|nr:hypothetical protein [Bacillota bacterium]